MLSTMAVIDIHLAEQEMKHSSLTGSPDMKDYLINESTSLRLSDVRGRRIDCTSGQLWISIAGQAEDFYVAAGESFIVPANGLLLLGTLSSRPARARIAQPLPLSLLARLQGLVLRGLRVDASAGCHGGLRTQ